MRSYYSHNKESGAVLAISLILLLVITLVGLSTYQTTGLEETMAANAQQKNMSFQASEAAIEELLDPDQKDFLWLAYPASQSDSINDPTRTSTSSGSNFTVVSTATFLDLSLEYVEEDSAVSVSMDSNSLVPYNFRISAATTLANTYSQNTNVQGAFIMAPRPALYSE